jgi:hypothetical protein
MYEPKILLCRVGEAVRIRSSDPTSHNVRIVAKKNREINQIVKKDEEFTYTPTAPEFLYTMCDIHPWMRAWLIVQEHPYYAVTDGEGNAWIHNIPAGTYKLRIWHAELGEHVGEVVIEDRPMDERAAYYWEYPQK